MEPSSLSSALDVTPGDQGGGPLGSVVLIEQMKLAGAIKEVRSGIGFGLLLHCCRRGVVNESLPESSWSCPGISGEAIGIGRRESVGCTNPATLRQKWETGASARRGLSKLTRIRRGDPVGGSRTG